MLDEELLELLVGKVDAELLEAETKPRKTAGEPGSTWELDLIVYLQQNETLKKKIE